MPDLHHSHNFLCLLHGSKWGVAVEDRKMQADTFSLIHAWYNMTDEIKQGSASVCSFVVIVIKSAEKFRSARSHVNRLYTAALRIVQPCEV